MKCKAEKANYEKCTRPARKGKNTCASHAAKEDDFASREAFRQRLGAWVLAHGGVEVEKPEFNSITNGMMGGRWELPTKLGVLVIHMPADGFLHIHSRFADWGEAKLPSDANPYSGKWNFYGEDEDSLFNRYTWRAEALLIQPWTESVASPKAG